MAGHILDILCSVRYWPEKAYYNEKRALFMKKGRQKFHPPPIQFLF